MQDAVYIILSPSWLIVLAITTITILGFLFKEFYGSIKRKINRFRIKMFFYAMNILEPSDVMNFLRLAEDTLKKISTSLETTNTELQRTRLDNMTLKDKISELEKNRKALIEELGGSSEFLDLEYSLWAQLVQTVDILIEDRIKLLSKIFEFDEVFNSKNSENKIRELYEQINQMKLQIEHLRQEKEKDNNEKIKLSNLLIAKQESSECKDLEIKKLNKIKEDLEFRLLETLPKSSPNESIKLSSSLEQEYSSLIQKYRQQALDFKRTLRQQIKENKLLREYTISIESDLNISLNEISGLQQYIVQLEEKKEQEYYGSETISELHCEIGYWKYQVSKILARSTLCSNSDYEEYAEDINGELNKILRDLE